MFFGCDSRSPDAVEQEPRIGHPRGLGVQAPPILGDLGNPFARQLVHAVARRDDVVFVVAEVFQIANAVAGHAHLLCGEAERPKLRTWKMAAQF